MNRELFLPQGRHYQDKEGTNADTCLVEALPNYRLDIDKISKRVTSTLYNNSPIKTEVFLKLLKLEQPSYKELTTVPFKDSEGIRQPYGSLIVALKLLGIGEREYNAISPFTYQEAYSSDVPNSLRTLVFSNIDIEDMMSNLGYEVVKSEEIDVNTQIYDESGNCIGTKVNHHVYEICKVETTKLLEDSGTKAYNYAVKMVCPSENKKAYIWIEDGYKDSSLSAIASTNRIQEDIYDDVVSFKRQGDIFIIDKFTKGFDLSRIDPTKPKRVLSIVDYFKKLTAES